MTTKKIGCCFFQSDNNDLYGILTDGDIRKLLISNSKLDTIELSDINLVRFEYPSIV